MIRIKYLLLFLVIAVILNINGALASERSFLDNTPRGMMGAWGGESSFKFDNEGKMADLSLKDPASYSGGYIIFDKTVDFSGYKNQGYVSFKIKGKIGSESLFVLLKDDQNYQIKVDLSRYSDVISGWKEVNIPLNDFPAIGENWETGELQTAIFDWTKVKAIIFQIQEREEVVYLKDIKLSDEISKSDLKALKLFINKKMVNSFGADLNKGPAIEVDQTGYYLKARKIALVSNLAATKLPLNYHIRGSKTDKTVFSGSLDGQGVFDSNSGDTLWSIDFSDLRDTGKYYIEIPNFARSCDFEINDNIYERLFAKVMKGFYYQRCGMALEKTSAGEWSHKACHLNDAYLDKSALTKEQSKEVFINSLGGWHDAGDYGKKVVPGALSAGILLKLYEMHPQLGMLDEIMYELKWLLTMQRADGAVYHLITTQKFPPLGTMPEDDKAVRYITGVSSTATADFAACLAIASRIFKDVAPQFSEKALLASEKAWDFLAKNPEIVPKGGYHDPEDIKGTGKYEDSDDRDGRFWAATELFKTTGNLEYNAYVIQKCNSWDPTVASPLTWQDVHNLGMFTYLFIENSPADDKLKEKIKNDVLKYANAIIKRINDNGYRVALEKEDYCWGSNSVALNYALILIMANKISPNHSYLEGVIDQLHYILGRNPLNLSYVTGVGTNYPHNIHHNPSIGDGIKDPVPGLLVGGPDAQADDPVIANLLHAYKLPPAKAYADDKYSYSSNEIAIYWNAMLAFVVGNMNGKF